MSCSYDLPVRNLVTSAMSMRSVMTERTSTTRPVGNV
ncbi:hypothetical protein CP157_02169 [Paracoccus marcusii]|nr:hypothetical protein CP157_02169 [Paracoccus marcusii]